MAQLLELTEYQQCVWDAPLDHGQLRALAAAHISVSPLADRDGGYRLRPSSYVGAVNIGDLAVIVRPKIPVGPGHVPHDLRPESQALARTNPLTWPPTTTSWRPLPWPSPTVRAAG